MAEAAIQELANRSGRQIVLDPAAIATVRSGGHNMIIEAEYVSFLSSDVDVDNPVDSLRAAGWRILDQRFPRQAYVVVGYPEVKLID